MSDKIFPAALKPIVSKSYGQTRGGNIWRSQVQGGLPRQGRDVFYDAVPISVVLVVGALGRQAFWKFISSISGGADSFQMTHDSGNGLEPHNVMISSNISETTQDGINWVISFTATAERTSVQDDDELTEALPPLYGEYGDGLIDFLDWYAIYCTTPNFIFDYDGDEPVQAVGTTAYFDGKLYYINNNAAAFGDLVTFSRLSGATYIDKDGVLKTAAINEPRFEKDGLLIEGQSTNYLVNSEDCSFSVTANTTTERDGEWYVFRKLSAGNGASYTYLDLKAINGIAPISPTVCVSCLVKLDTSFQTSGTLIFNSRLDGTQEYQTARFDIGKDMANGTTTSGVISRQAQKISEGVYKISMVLECTSTSSQRAFYITLSGGAAKDEDGAYLYSIARPQIEALPFATSYIPTNGAAATRAADSASVLMQSHTNGTIFCKFLSDAIAIERIVYTAGAITMRRLATGAISVTSGDVTVTSAVISEGSVKSAISYDGVTLKLAVNGVVYSAASALPSAGTSLVLGASTFANVWQRSEAYDNARLAEVTQ